jgi:hypothetical protein
MHGCNVKLGSCSIISRVSSRSSLQSSHGSLGFLSNVFWSIFARKLMNGQIHLFCLETRLRKTPSLTLVA